MIHFTQLVLNPSSRMVQNEMVRPYELHRTIQSAFQSSRQENNVLFRLDVNPRGLPMLLVQSKSEPNLAEWEGKDNGRYLRTNPRTKAVSLQVSKDILYRFRLCANPSKKMKREGQKNSQRVGLYKTEDQVAWLNRKAEQFGFKLLTANTSPSQRLVDRNKKITLYTVVFDGQLIVIDDERFTQALHSGIGPSKAFGCGLLSLARG